MLPSGYIEEGEGKGEREGEGCDSEMGRGSDEISGVNEIGQRS